MDEKAQDVGVIAPVDDSTGTSVNTPVNARQE